jgi:hypothetical protein
VKKFVFVTVFYVQCFCILVEKNLFCCNLACHENALLRINVDAAWILALSSVLFLLEAKDDPTNVMVHLNLLMRGKWQSVL